jgi:hypothetical protein
MSISRIVGSSFLDCSYDLYDVHFRRMDQGWSDCNQSEIIIAYAITVIHGANSTIVFMRNQMTDTTSSHGYLIQAAKNLQS